MSKFLPIVFILAASFIFTQQIAAQDFPFEKYQTRTLAELVEMESDSVKQGNVATKGVLIDAKPFYSAIRVKFIGNSRPISAEKKNLLKIWQESLGYEQEILGRFENEYLFKECDKQYWIPVQKQLAEYFPKELKENDTITLYLMVVGGLKLEKDWEYVFLVNEFQKY